MKESCSFSRIQFLFLCVNKTTGPVSAAQKRIQQKVFAKDLCKLSIRSPGGETYNDPSHITNQVRRLWDGLDPRFSCVRC